jgi:hypothetical protein
LYAWGTCDAALARERALMAKSVFVYFLAMIVAFTAIYALGQAVQQTFADVLHQWPH